MALIKPGQNFSSLVSYYQENKSKKCRVVQMIKCLKKRHCRVWLIHRRGVLATTRQFQIDCPIQRSQLMKRAGAHYDA